MRSLQARFEYMVKMNPELSTFVCFTKAIGEQGFSRETIKEHFDKLVDKSDYQRKDKLTLIDWLVSVSAKPKGE